MSDEARANARRGLGAWVRSTGRGLRKASPYGIYAFLTAAAVAPLAGPALGATGEFEIALNQLGGMGGNHLATVMSDTAGRLRERGEPVSDEQWRDAVAAALAERLSSTDRSDELIAEVRTVLHAVDAVECALAESAVHAEDLHRELLAAAAVLRDDFGDVRWTLLEVRGLVAQSNQAIAQVQRELIEQRGREREESGFTQRVLVGLTRMRHVLRQSAQPAPSGPCPYPGLSGFNVADAPSFFGREQFLAEVIARIAEGVSPVLVVGASGAGKSSFLRAGLLPTLGSGEVPGLGTSILLTPGAWPLRELAARVAVLLGLSAADVYARLRDDPAGFGALTRQAALTGDRLVLVVDQFEELFTQCGDPAERKAFVSALAAASQEGIVVAAIRGDFFERCAAFPELAGALSEPAVLGPMAESDLRRAITAPAEQARLPIEPGLVDLMIADHGERPESGALPLLAHALHTTWHAADGAALTLSAYQSSGGIGRSIATSAESVYRELDDAGKAAVRSILPRMITVLDDHAIARRRVDREVLPAAVLEPWITARLLTVDENTVQFSHEALLTAWPRLAEWVAEDRDQLRVRQQLDDAAGEWIARNHSPDTLFRGAKLAAAQAVAADLTPREHDFVKASTRAQRRSTRLLGGLTVGLAAFSVVALIATLLALSARSDAEDAAAVSLSRQLAAESALTMAGDPHAAVGLAVEAWAAAETPAAHGALVSASMETLPTTVDLADEPVVSLDVNSSGGLFAAGLRSGKVVLWDVARDAVVPADLSGHTGTVVTTRFSPDGSLLATGSVEADGVRIWSMPTGEPVSVLPALGVIDWRPDGKTVAGAGFVGDSVGIVVWDVRTGDRLAAFGATENLIASVRYAPNGERLAVSYFDGTVRLWNPGAGTLLATIDATDELSAAIGMSNDLLVTVGTDEPFARLWDTRDGTEAGAIPIAGGTTTVSFASGGTELLTSDGSEVNRWYVPDRGPLKTYEATGDAVQVLAVSDDNRTLVVGNSSGDVVRWRRNDQWYLGDGRTAATAIGFDPTNGRATAAFSDGAWHTFDIGSVTAVATGTGSDYATDVIYTQDGTRVVLRNDGVVELTHPTGETLRTQPIEGVFRAGGLALSPDGSLIAAHITMRPMPEDDERESRIRIWSAIDLTERALIDVSDSGAGELVFAENRLLATTLNGDPALRAWDVADFAELPRVPLPTHSHAAALTRDGSRLVVGGRKLHVIDLATGRVTAEFGDHPALIRTLDVAADGTIATGTTEDSVVRLWRLDTGALVASYTGDLGGSLNDVRFSPDGSLVASASTFGNIGLWPTDPLVALRSICSRLAPDAPTGCADPPS